MRKKMVKVLLAFVAVTGLLAVAMGFLWNPVATRALNTPPLQKDPQSRSLSLYDEALPRSIKTPTDQIVATQKRINMEADLIALGPVALATALIEVHQQLRLYCAGVFDAAAALERTQLMLEVWARMPAQNVLPDSASRGLTCSAP